MRFQVRRTSSDGEMPCEEATEHSYLETYSHEAKSFEEWDALKFPSNPHKRPWLSDGLNHRVTEQGIARDFPATGWFVEIEDLKALMAFIARHGQVIIEPPNERVSHPSLEIYDDYRE